MSDDKKVVSLFEPTPDTALKSVLEMKDDIDFVYVIFRKKSGGFYSAGSIMNLEEKSLLVHYAQLDILENIAQEAGEADDEDA